MPRSPLARVRSILRTSGCDTLSGPTSSRRLCAKFAHAFLSPLLGSRGLQLQTLAQLAARRRRESWPTGRKLACFDQLLVGGAFDVFNSEALNHGKEPLLALYRARVLSWHGVPPLAVPTSHTILL